MFETEKSFLQEAIIKPLKNNLSSVMFWVGLLFVFLGAIFGIQIDALDYTPQGTGEAILKGGSAILGAGVFAVIMKSGQFTNLFQKHIYDVFYNPSNVKEGVPIIEKWRIITNAILESVLPVTHNEAVDLIEKQFFNSELEYHFEDHISSYQISIDSQTKVATVRSITHATIVLSPNAENPTLKQSITTGGNFTLLALRINGQELKCNTSELTSLDPDNPNKHDINIPLIEYATHSATKDKVVKFERVIEWTQNLDIEPYIKAIIGRYIKGARVRVRVPRNYKIHFEKFGLGMSSGDDYIKDDGEGFERWLLAAPGNLLLPGQGFIIVIAPLKAEGGV